MASTLGYTAMTVSRVAMNLIAAGLATSYFVGDRAGCEWSFRRSKTWERARTMLRTPVKRTVWVPGDSVAEVRYGWYSQRLARYSMPG